LLRLSPQPNRSRCAGYRFVMANSDTPWEPPLAGTEAQHLVASLNRLRTTFRWKTDGLDSAGLRVGLGASRLTLGGLLKHLARAEDECFTKKLSGLSANEPWVSADWASDPDWDFNSADNDTARELYALWDSTIARSHSALDGAVENGGFDQLIFMAWPDGRRASLRRLVCDLIEEYGRHTGHADLIREAVDGRVGEDPPPGWRPESI
jgi:Protein of unknown function (DUF664)